MSDYLESDFCDPDQGLDYLFARMGAIYGATFIRHWEGVDLEIVRDTWKEVLGIYLTYRPKLDQAIYSMDDTFIPSALAVKKLCMTGERIPSKPHSEIGYSPGYSSQDKEFVKEQFRIMREMINKKTYKEGK